MAWARPTLILLLAASTLLYAGGVALNDVYDADVDRQERPERPIPSGRVSLAAARRLGWMLLIAGAAIPWVVSWQVGHIRPGLIALRLGRGHRPVRLRPEADAARDRADGHVPRT